jgi:hypothetical protein
MDNHQNKDELLKEAKELCLLLTTNLPRRVDSAEISLTAKIPFKALHYRAALFWRTEELARIACELFERNELASAMTLTRSCMETSAALWYLMGKVQKAIDSGDVESVDAALKRLIAGSRNNSSDFDAINVLNFVDWVDKAITGFRKMYEGMCEYAHPNWSGTSSLFANPNKERRWIDFGNTIRDNEAATMIGLLSLNQSLHIFSHINTRVNEIMPAFIELCENKLSEKNNK